MPVLLRIPLQASVYAPCSREYSCASVDCPLFSVFQRLASAVLFHLRVF